MRVIVLAALFGASFIACCMTVALMNWVFALSFAVFVLTTTYMNRHEKELNAELDEMFGKDKRLG